MCPEEVQWRMDCCRLRGPHPWALRDGTGRSLQAGRLAGRPAPSYVGGTRTPPGRARSGQHAPLCVQRARGMGRGGCAWAAMTAEGDPWGPESVATVRWQLCWCGFQWRPSTSSDQKGRELGRITAESSPTSCRVSHCSWVPSPRQLGELNPGGVKPLWP